MESPSLEVAQNLTGQGLEQWDSSSAYFKHRVRGHSNLDDCNSNH